jgi:hypothetical protein
MVIGVHVSIPVKRQVSKKNVEMSKCRIVETSKRPNVQTSKHKYLLHILVTHLIPPEMHTLLTFASISSGLSLAKDLLLLTMVRRCCCCCWCVVVAIVVVIYCCVVVVREL